MDTHTQESLRRIANAVLALEDAATTQARNVILDSLLEPLTASDVLQDYVNMLGLLTQLDDVEGYINALLSEVD